jgi:hypothetical protein
MDTAALDAKFSDMNMMATGCKLLSAFLPRCTKLSTLDISRNDAGAEGVKHIVDIFLEGPMHPDNRELISLDISGNAIGTLGAKYVSQALELDPALRSLNISSNELYSEGDQHIARALEINTLLATCVVDKYPLPVQEIKTAKDIDLTHTDLTNLDAIVIAGLIQKNRWVNCELAG